MIFVQRWISTEKQEYCVGNLVLQQVNKRSQFNKKNVLMKTIKNKTLSERTPNWTRTKIQKHTFTGNVFFVYASAIEKEKRT